MQLKQVKLAGFKSFADPTSLEFPSELVAIVGPNGCGKSNIIDAIRWVLGESSARALRGDAMEDVIFKGSSQRKPLGQASVEMIFDNSLRRFAGPYASYGEISIRRVVTKDGASNWFLNKTRCRRKDILDLFAGTGARGYSIISQGEISRLIEARPEVLRMHLEEAAGVSLYRERRKETLSRMDRTRENLARLQDIREELGKQLQHLEKQAACAERYLALKQEEKHSRATILILKLQEITQEQSVKETQLQQLLQDREQQSLENAAFAAQQDVLAEQLQQTNDTVQQKQQQLYESGLTIARLQENLSQYQREKNQLTHDEQQIKTDIHTATIQQETCRETWQLAVEKTQMLDNQIQVLQEESERLAQTLSQILAEKTARETAGQQKQTDYNQQSSTLQILAATVKNNESRQQELAVRLEKLTTEKAALTADALQAEALHIEQELAFHIQEKNILEIKNNSLQTQKNTLQTELNNLEKAIRQADDTYRQCSIGQAALKAAQSAVRPENKDAYPVESFLSKPRLVDILEVEKDWQFALEQVLGDTIKALVLDNCQEFWPHLALYTVGEQVVTWDLSVKKRGLAAKILGACPASAVALDTIHTAETLEAALETLPHLQSHESIITQEGYWLGPGWIRIPSGKNEDNAGLLQRQTQILSLDVMLREQEENLLSLRHQRDSLYEALQTSEQESNGLQDALRALQTTIRDRESRLDANRQQQSWCLKKQASLETEYSQLEAVQAELLEAHQASIQQYAILAAAVQILEKEQVQYEADRQALAEKVLHQQKIQEMAKQDLYQCLRDFDKNKASEEQSQAGLLQTEDRLIILQERLENWLIRRETVSMDCETHSLQLQQHAETHRQLEAQLQAIKQQQTDLQESLATLEKTGKKRQDNIKKLEENMAEKRLETQALSLRITTLQETMAEQSIQIDTLLNTYDKTTTRTLEEKNIKKIMEAIAQLGAINLAAVEECQQAKTRKEQLDTQHLDLEEALQMLQVAIEKMDRETKTRLSETFDAINALFQTLFPKLFGGGNARLEWTSTNVLEAGILVMAQPPGKKNSSIQLLSGGEKAMAAIALTFAIFQHNPAPFCMLDEVDAPLDEVNVSRFCKVVKEMSKFVQFLFITHNKTTMELAKQLIGVTMREPGISRLVTVDLKQALSVE